MNGMYVYFIIFLSALVTYEGSIVQTCSWYRNAPPAKEGCLLTFHWRSGALRQSSRTPKVPKKEKVNIFPRESFVSFFLKFDNVTREASCSSYTSI